MKDSPLTLKKQVAMLLRVHEISCKKDICMQARKLEELPSNNQQESYFSPATLKN
jgi:hypothetical protein